MTNHDALNIEPTPLSALAVTLRLIEEAAIDHPDKLQDLVLQAMDLLNEDEDIAEVLASDDVETVLDYLLGEDGYEDDEDDISEQLDEIREQLDQLIELLSGAFQAADTDGVDLSVLFTSFGLGVDDAR